MARPKTRNRTARPSMVAECRSGWGSTSSTARRHSPCFTSPIRICKSLRGAPV